MKPNLCWSQWLSSSFDIWTSDWGIKAKYVEDKYALKKLTWKWWLMSRIRTNQNASRNTIQYPQVSCWYFRTRQWITENSARCFLAARRVLLSLQPAVTSNIHWKMRASALCQGTREHFLTGQRTLGACSRAQVRNWSNSALCSALVSPPVLSKCLSFRDWAGVCLTLCRTVAFEWVLLGHEFTH